MRPHTSLRAKLTVLVALPLLVLAVASVVAARSAAQSATNASRTSHRIDLAVAASAAALQLAQERALSASTFQAPADEGQTVPEELAFQRDQTSEAIAALRRAAGPAAEDAPMGSALERLGRLDAARSRVDEGNGDTASVLDSYAEIIDPVLDFDETLADVGNPSLITGIGSHEALTRAIQDVALEQSLLSTVFRSGQVDPAVYQQLLGVVTTQDMWLDLFEDKASMSQRQGYEELATVPAVATVQRLREQVLSAGPAGSVEPDTDVWTSAIGRKLDLLEGIAQETADHLTTTAGDAAAQAAARRTVALGVAGAALALAAVMLLLLHRSVTRPLSQHVAATRLALADGTPVQVPAVRELHDLATAFNTVQEEAANRAATPPAPTPGAAPNSVYLRFGRRTQALISEQLRHIDELEARTEDPDTLSDLFLLDHLATRLRRNAESQVVVAGADTPRAWSRPVSVTNVVRAAAAAAADYSRVEVQPMPPASVIGNAANDVSHLLAEVIDEALVVLPDHLRVVIGGARHHDGRYVVAVSGVGLRLTPAELAAANTVLATGPGGPQPGEDDAVDDGLDRDLRFRLYVVAQLARRHQVEVRVGQAAGGTIAEITLPHALLADSAPVPGMASGAPLSAPAPAASPPPVDPSVVDGTMQPPIPVRGATRSNPRPPRPSVVASGEVPVVDAPPPGTASSSAASSSASSSAPSRSSARSRRRATTQAGTSSSRRPKRKPRRFRWRRKIVERAPRRRNLDPWADWQDG